MYSLAFFFIYIPLGLVLVAVPWVGFALAGLLLFGLLWLPLIMLDLVPAQKDGGGGVPNGPPEEGGPE